ncbi:MAG TPA: pyrroloquinoline quinone biosynthesis peptide chaperone PqqD [Terriglobales bacterium]|nr:pyrroloquinoline quinone biosynthesis peptide chaperone PqqD [Terriglobales bacterium]
MSRPVETSKPRLAAGCRVGDLPGQTTLLLIPEGAFELNGPGVRIVSACDGERTFREIVRMLQQEYRSADPDRIEQETADLLERLHLRRVVDF